MKETNGKPEPQIAAELLALSRGLVASRLSVKKLRQLIDRDKGSVNPDELVGQLIAENHLDGAQALAIAAGLSGLDVDAHCLPDILPLVDDIRGLPLLMHLTRGDRQTNLLDTVESGALSWERSALVLLFLADSCKDNPPSRFLAAMRTLARQPLSLEAGGLLGSAAILINDPEVNKVADRHLKMSRFLGKSAQQHQQRLLHQPDINDLPERDPATVIAGRTVMREGSKVGRNEPCPCGSGKKHKKCCLGKAQPVLNPATDHGTSEQASQRTLGWKMTHRQFSGMRIQELCQQDLSTLKSEFLAIALQQFCKYHYWDNARRTLEELSGRDDLRYDEALDDYRHELIYEALKAGQIDYVREQIGLLDFPDKMDDSVRLQIKLRDPDQNTLQELDDYVRRHLQQQDDVSSNVDLAYALLETFPALGIFFARGAISSKRLLDSEMLLERIEEARDALQLPAGDEGQEIFDRIYEQSVDEHLLKHAEQAASQAQQVALRKTEVVREQYRASRQRINDLEVTLLDKESHLKELLSKLDQPGSKESAEALDTRADGPDPVVLRGKITELKALLDLGNKERRQLRRQLLEATNRMVETGDPDTERVVEDVEPLETVDLTDSRQVRLIRRFPVFSNTARKSMQKIPVQVADAAMLAIAELSSAGVVAWSSVKRLKGAPSVFSQRIGIHHRLLFSLDMEGDELVVQDLIHRRELEKAVKHYAG